MALTQAERDLNTWLRHLEWCHSGCNSYHDDEPRCARGEALAAKLPPTRIRASEEGSDGK